MLDQRAPYWFSFPPRASFDLMLRISKKGDYAVFLMGYLAQHGPVHGEQVVSAQEIADRSGVNKSVVANLLAHLEDPCTELDVWELPICKKLGVDAPVAADLLTEARAASSSLMDLVEES